MSKHTPGPCGGEGGPDARLIAAAPELLEALESVLDALGALGNRHELNNRLSSNECQQVWAAYDKARGES